LHWKRLTDNQLHLALAISPIVICVLIIVGLELRDDPRTIAGTQSGNGKVTFTQLPESQRMFRMTRDHEELPVYFTLFPEERLVAPVRVVACEDVLPGWIPRYAKAERIACLRVRTNFSQSRSLASILVPAGELSALYGFYKKAFTETSGLDEDISGMLPNEPNGADVNAFAYYKDREGVTRATVDYYRMSPITSAVVLIEIH
jgi:hypothetical protein